MPTLGAEPTDTAVQRRQYEVNRRALEMDRPVEVTPPPPPPAPNSLVGEPLTPETRQRFQYEVNRLAMEMEHRGILTGHTLTGQLTTTGGINYAMMPQINCRTDGVTNIAMTLAVPATDITTGGTFALTAPSITMTTNATGTCITVPNNIGIEATAVINALQVMITNCAAATNQLTVNFMNNQELWTVWTQATACINNTCTTAYAYADNQDWYRRDDDWKDQYWAKRAAWNLWNDRYQTIHEAKADADRIIRYSRRQLSEAELVAELNREKELRRQAEEAERKRREADDKAMMLLRSCLSPAQIADLESKRCFYVEVEGRAPGKKERYRIDRDNHQVKQIDEKGSIIRSFCIYVPGVPQGDTMLAQKLFLEASEETRTEFWETANISAMKAEKEIPHNIPRRERRRYAVEHGLLH